jgi:ribosomal protein S24E
MNYNVLDEKQNDLLKRKELKLEVEHVLAATPSKAELLKELATAYSVPEENIIIDYIFTQKGIGKSVAKVKIYKEKPKLKEKKEVKKVKKEEAKSEAQASQVQ